MDGTRPSAPLLYPHLSTFNKRNINEKKSVNSKLNIYLNIIKGIRNYYENDC